MALFFECVLQCAQKVLDAADIVRDGDFPTIGKSSPHCEDNWEVFYLRTNAARRIAPIIMSDPPIVATNPSDIRNPPNAVLGSQGPNPDANVSVKAAMPTPKEIAPYLAKFFTPLF